MSDESETVEKKKVSKKVSKKASKDEMPRGVKFTKVAIPGQVLVDGSTWLKMSKMGIMQEVAGRLLDEALKER